MGYWGQGTRQDPQMGYSHPETRFPNNKLTRDVGLSKRVVSSAAVFSGSTIVDAGQTWTVFAVNDEVVVNGSASNNGVRVITAVTASSITCDFPVKSETVSGYSIEVRTL